MLLAPIIWALTAVICYYFAAKTWWFPPPINAHGIAYDAQFMRTLIVIGIIFFLAQFALGWVIVRFRDDGRPRRIFPRQQQARSHLDQRHRAAVPRPGADGHARSGPACTSTKRRPTRSRSRSWPNSSPGASAIPGPTASSAAPISS